MALPNITPQRVKFLRDLINTTLKDISAQQKLDIRAGNASYGDSYIDFKLTCTLKGDKNEILGKEAEAFKDNAYLLDMKPEDLGKKFKFNNKTYTLIGMKTKSRKFPLLGKRDDGKVYKFAPSIKFID